MIDETVTVDNNGNWDFKVPKDLAPGKYTITLKGVDINGNPVEKPYSFTVYSSASISSPLPSSGLNPANFVSYFTITLLFVFAVVLTIKKIRTFEERILEKKKC